MFKRTAAAFLWFLMVWVGYEILWSVFGVPRLLGPVAAAFVASGVVLDPLGAFWPHRDTDDPLSVLDANVHGLTSGAESSAGRLT